MIEFLEKHLLPCPFKLITGCDCPGCGMQRAIIHALKGEITESLATHPTALPGLVLLAFIFFNLFKKLSHGSLIIRWGMVLLGSLSVLQWLIKLIIG